MLDWSQCPAVERQPDKVSGAWLFKGTRVPVKALLENIEAGARIDDSSSGSRVCPGTRWRPFSSTPS